MDLLPLTTSSHSLSLLSSLQFPPSSLTSMLLLSTSVFLPAILSEFVRNCVRALDLYRPSVEIPTQCSPQYPILQLSIPSSESKNQHSNTQLLKPSATMTRCDNLPWMTVNLHRQPTLTYFLAQWFSNFFTSRTLNWTQIRPWNPV